MSLTIDLPDDDHLCPTELRQLHAVLTFQLDALLARGRTTPTDGTVEEIALDPDTSGLAWGALVRERDRARLDDVLAALARVQKGAYGRCGGCDEGIGYARLFARPTATTCVACAEVSNGFVAA